MEKNTKELVKNKTGEVVPIEPVQAQIKGEVAALTLGGDPDVMLQILEKKAQLAPRFKKARDTIILTQTYKEDWVVFGDTACLKSAAAERIGTMFEISFYDLKIEKENFTDSLGKGYRYRAQITAELYGRKSIGVGLYDTREPFLGVKNKEYRPIEEINENDIQMAAVHIARGDAVKALLGLRGIPIKELDNILKGTSQTAAKVEFKSGSQGGTAADDSAKQTELYNLCRQIADMPATVYYNQQTKDAELQITQEEAESASIDERISIICRQLSTFVNSKGELVKGKLYNELTGKWLNSTLGRAKRLLGVDDE